MPVIAPIRLLTSPNAKVLSGKRAGDAPGLYAFELHTCEGRQNMSGLLATIKPHDEHVLRGQEALTAEVTREVGALKAGEGATEPLVLMHHVISLRDLPRNGAATVFSTGCAELRMWKIDGAASEQIAQALKNERVVLAAGHARYEAALEMGEGGQIGPPLLAAFVHCDDGMRSRPVHRVVSGIQGFETGEFIRIARANFFFREASRAMRGLPANASHPVLNHCEPHFNSEMARRLMSPEEAPPPLPVVTLEQAGAKVAPGVARNSYVEDGDVVMLAVTSRATYRLHSKPGWADTILAHVPPLQRKLDVVQLHRIILEKVLKISPLDVREERHVRFESDAGRAVDEAGRGADVAFIMNALPLNLFCETAMTGAVLPPRSLEIVPAFPKGLVSHALA